MLCSRSTMTVLKNEIVGFDPRVDGEPKKGPSLTGLTELNSFIESGDNMRFSAFGSAIGALALVQSVAGIENAAVYKLKNGECQSHGLTIPQNDATLNLAYEFGIAKFYNVEDVEDLNNVLLGSRRYEETDNDDGKQLILIINGVENPSDFLSSYDIAPTFDVAIKDDRHSSSLKSFLSDIPNKLYTLNRNSGYYLNKLSNEITILTDSNKKASYLKNLWNKFFHQEETNKIENLWGKLKGSVERYGSLPEQEETVLRINKRSMDHINDESFISELTQLEFFLEEQLKNNSKNDKVVINIDSLISIFKKTGVTQTYETCQNIISKVVVDKLHKHDDISATIVVLPLDQSLVTVKSNERFQKQQHLSGLRKRSEDSLFVKSSNACFANQLACIESTDSCSDHGLCTLVGSCWKCLCSATVDENDRTSYWTGASCEKADYSSQFNLLLWTTIVLIVSIVAGVKLLYKCGEQELPGVLLAATVQTKKST